MAELPQTVRRRTGPALLLALLLGPTGCVGLDYFTLGHDTPPKGPACKVLATWIPEVIKAPDTEHEGTPVPCLAGRVYLFGADMTHPVGADGALLVDLFDPDHRDPAGKPTQLERWVLDPDTLNQKFLRRDMVGWGYTVILPWNTWRPDITRVEMRVRYQPKDGSPLFAEPSPLTLGGQAGQPTIKQTANVVH